MYAYENKIVHVYLRALVFPAIKSSISRQNSFPRFINLPHPIFRVTGTCSPEGNSIPSPSLVRLQREARRISRLSHFNLMQCQWHAVKTFILEKDDDIVT